MTTINPIVDSEGNYAGSEIVGERQGWQSSDADIIERADGSRAHIFGDVELDSDNEGFSFDSYAADLRVAYPQLDSAIAWAAQSGAPGFDIAGYNNAVDTEDLEAINAYSERLIGLYEEALQSQSGEQRESLTEVEETEEEPDTELDSWFEQNITDEFIDETIDHITDAEFTYEQGEQMQDLQENYSPDTAEHFLLELGQAITNGEISGEEAIQYALQSFSEAEVARAYVTLQSQLN
jgi:hypothetical protein